MVNIFKKNKNSELFKKSFIYILAISILGIGFSKLVAGLAASAGYSIVKISFPLFLIIGTLLFAFLVGTISGSIPAYKASKLKPVDALRYE